MLDFTDSELEICYEKIISAAGLALRAGKCILGSELCIKSIRSNKAKLAITVSDISDNTRKKLTDSTDYHKVKLLTLPCTKEYLGQKLGKKAKVSCSVITDDGFVKIIEKIYSDIHTRFTEVQQ